MREPLVDTVDLKAVVTKPYEIRTFDLKTVKKEDLTFVANFVLEATRRDCKVLYFPIIHDADVLWLAFCFPDVHALLAWFDVSFKASHKPLGFSTGPHAKYSTLR